MIPRHFCKGRLPLAAIVVAIWAALASGHDGAKAQAPAQAVRMEHVSIDATGSGSPVILIPGLSSPAAVWDGIAPELAKSHRVYRVQVNGFAGDDPGANLKPGILDGIVAEVEALIVRDKLEKPAVIGHSMGGLVGLMLAARHPQQVGRLMVVDAAPFIGSLMMGAPDVAAIEPQAAQMRDRLRAGYDPARPAPAVAADPGGNMSITPQGRIQVARWSAKADPRVVAEAMYEDLTTDVRPELAKITARPFTILYAAGMGEAEAKAAWEPQYAGSAARLVAVPKSYHFVMLDQPEAFRAAVADFLK